MAFTLPHLANSYSYFKTQLTCYHPHEHFHRYSHRVHFLSPAVSLKLHISIPLSQASSQSFFTQLSFIMAQTADQALTLTSGLFSSFLCNLRKVSSHLQLSPCGGIHYLVSCYRNISTSLWPLSALGPFHLKIHLVPRKQRE